MSLYGAGVEYGIHCLLHLVDAPEASWPSARDVAEFQGLSPAYVAKLFTQLQKAGIVRSSGGVAGGFRLAQPAEDITVLAIVDALEIDNPLFQCREIRKNCVLYQRNSPDWTVRGVCAVHATMLAAEEKMREVLAQTTLASLGQSVARKRRAGEVKAVRTWFDARQATRRKPGRARKAASPAYPMRKD